jgi:hypothetical protein
MTNRDHEFFKKETGIMNEYVNRNGHCFADKMKALKPERECGVFDIP